MTFGITFIHSQIIHSFDKPILTNPHWIKHETPPWVFILFLQQITINDIHDLTGITTLNDFYDNYDFTKLYDIFGVPMWYQ